MIMLGIDPGYDRVGVALIEKNNLEETIIFSGCIETNKKETHSKRIKHIADELEKIIIKYEIKNVCVESIFVFKNQKTVMMVAEARGVINYICEKNNLSILEMTPMQIKNSITGYGHADKKQVKYMLEKILKMTFENKKLDDEIDAIACSLAGLAFSKNI
jgi:crossover junction endodeoxyribonuclease RuvC